MGWPCLSPIWAGIAIAKKVLCEQTFVGRLDQMALVSSADEVFFPLPV